MKEWGFFRVWAGTSLRELFLKIFIRTVLGICSMQINCVSVCMCICSNNSSNTISATTTAIPHQQQQQQQQSSHFLQVHFFICVECYFESTTAGVMLIQLNNWTICLSIFILNFFFVSNKNCNDESSKWTTNKQTVTFLHLQYTGIPRSSWELRSF